MRLRNFFAKKIMASAGTNINIEKGATFSRRLSIGNNSGLGVNSRVQGKVSIRDDVMMGPDVLIYTTNHEFKSKDIPANCVCAGNPAKVIEER